MDMETKANYKIIFKSHACHNCAQQRLPVVLSSQPSDWLLLPAGTITDTGHSPLPVGAKKKTLQRIQPRFAKMRPVALDSKAATVQLQAGRKSPGCKPLPGPGSSRRGLASEMTAPTPRLRWPCSETRNWLKKS